VPAILRMSSWMGGDRDGNPFVTPDVTIEAVRALRLAVLRRHLASIDALGGRLSQSVREVSVSDELRASLAADDARSPELGAKLEKRYPFELYRRKCAHVRERLRRAIAYAELVQPAFYRDSPLATGEGHYHVRDELHADLAVMARSLRSHGAQAVADGALRDVMREV